MNKSSNQNQKRGPAQGGSKRSKPKRNREGRIRTRQFDMQGKQIVVSAPVAVTKVTTVSRPQLKSTSNGDVTIRHREFIKNITGSVLFSSNRIVINPGLIGSFPWLATVANSYESYVFEKLDFRFETMSNTISTGAVVLAVDYDPSDSAPTDKGQAMAYRSAVRSSPWASSDHRSLKEDLNKRKTYFNRTGTVPGNISTYDTGNLFVCTEGQQTSTDIIGEIYADYVVKLMGPQLGDRGVGEAQYTVITGTGVNTQFQQVGPNLRLAAARVDNQNTTWTFNQPWEGFATFITNGTGMNTGGNRLLLTSSMAGQIQEIDNVNASATSKGITLYALKMSQGEILNIFFVNTTVSQADAYLGQALFF